MNKNWFLIILAVIEVIAIGFILYGAYLFMNMLCGG